MAVQGFQADGSALVKRVKQRLEVSASSFAAGRRRARNGGARWWGDAASRGPRGERARVR